MRSSSSRSRPHKRSRRRCPLPVATLEGDVLRGAHLVAGGGKVEARGILATKREIKELRERVATERECARTSRRRDRAVRADDCAGHRRDRGAVRRTPSPGKGHRRRGGAAPARVRRRSRGWRSATDVVATEMARARDEIATLDARQTEARESIARLDEDRRAAEARPGRRRSARWRRPATPQIPSRSAPPRRGRRMPVWLSEAPPSPPMWRGSRRRATELERRVATCATDLTLMRDQRERLLAAVAEGQRLMDDDVRRARGAARRHASRPTSARPSCKTLDRAAGRGHSRRPTRARCRPRAGGGARCHARHRRIRPRPPRAAVRRRRGHLAGRRARRSGSDGSVRRHRARRARDSRRGGAGCR